MRFEQHVSVQPVFATEPLRTQEDKDRRRPSLYCGKRARCVKENNSKSIWSRRNTVLNRRMRQCTPTAMGFWNRTLTRRLICQSRPNSDKEPAVQPDENYGPNGARSHAGNWKPEVLKGIWNSTPYAMNFAPFRGKISNRGMAAAFSVCRIDSDAPTFTRCPNGVC